MLIQPLSDGMLAALHRDEPVTAQRIEDLLDVLEENPRDMRVRQHQLRAEFGALPVTVWGFVVRGSSEDISVFWRFLDEDAGGEVSVDYIGPRTTGR